ncbi:hypothetical protein ACHAXR_008451 [Thalassiosira sp. AJA248-18]
MQSHGNQQNCGATRNGLGFQTNQSSTISTRPIDLYELEVGESDFLDLRRDQALLVDFNDFANSLISLLQFCELGEDNASLSQDQNGFRQTTFQDQQPCQQHYDSKSDWNCQARGVHQLGNINGTWSTPSQTPHQQSFNQQGQGMLYHGPRTSSPYGKMNSALPVSTYTCRLETNSPLSEDGMQWRNAPKPSSVSIHARFSIVESNQFRELTHLALNLNIGSDKSVRLYLSSRLSQTMMQNRSIQTLYVEQQRRSDAAETDLIGMKKRLQELTQSSEAEKCQIRYQAEERIQTENCSRLAEVNEVATAKDAEIKALNERSEKNRAVLANKVRVLEGINATINAEKTASENENERLATKLGYQETTNKTLTNELSSLRGQLQNVSGEKAAIEKSLHQLQLQLSSLEYSNNDREKTISHTEAQRISAEKVSTDAKQTLSRQQSQMEELRRRLEEAEVETSKYKDLTSRYQTNRLEMKKRIKEKVEIIREQEEVLITRDKEKTELTHRVKGLEDNLQRIRAENESGSQELNYARKQMEDDKKRLENNQQVIAWLNKQVNKSSGGAMWQGGRTASNVAGTATKAFPTPASMGHQVSSLSRYLPNATLTATQSYVTPEIKASNGVPQQQLHPGPTPYSKMPQRP